MMLTSSSLHSHSFSCAHLCSVQFVAYTALSKIQASTDPLTTRGFLIASYTLCGFGNIGSVGINIGVMSAIAPSRSADIIKLAPSALITGILVTLSSAAIAGIVVD
jgi:CNT family concentrative nucleoside transporter